MEDFYYTSYSMVAKLTIIIGFIGLGLFYYTGDIWKQIKKAFIYFFVPEVIYVQGIVVELKKNDVPLTDIPENDWLLHLCSMVIWKPMENEYYQFNLPYPEYKKIKSKEELNLDQKIILKCKKFGYTGDKLFPVWD